MKDYVTAKERITSYREHRWNLIEDCLNEQKVLLGCFQNLIKNEADQDLKTKYKKFLNICKENIQILYSKI